MKLSSRAFTLPVKARPTSAPRERKKMKKRKRKRKGEMALLIRYERSKKFWKIVSLVARMHESVGIFNRFLSRSPLMDFHRSEDTGAPFHHRPLREKNESRRGLKNAGNLEDQ